MVSERIRALREKSGIEVEALAQKLHVPVETVLMWEAGTLPDTEQLVALATLFGVTTDYLLGIGREAIDLTGLTDEERGILRRLSGYFRDRNINSEN